VLHVLTPSSSRTIDRTCIEDLGITGADLMTTAARHAVDVVEGLLLQRSAIVIACGGGNNGGDGFAMSHMLCDDHDVVVVTEADPTTMTEEARSHYERSINSVRHVRFDTLPPALLEDADVVIDALIGVGGTASLRDPLPSWLTMLNAASGLHIAVDVPTGLNALTGEVHDRTFRADVTITMEGPKAGFFLGRGPEHVGTIRVVSIGAASDLTSSCAVAHILEESDVELWLRPRDPRSHKYHFGRVVVIAGSVGMRGAASLTAEAVLRSGAGLCVLAAPFIHHLTPREVMTEQLEANASGGISATSRSGLERQLERATVVVVGPGIGTDGETLSLLRDIVNVLDPSIPVVIDADGLRIVPELDRDMSAVVLTPHEGEYRQLVAAVTSAAASPTELARELGCTIHRKGSPSVTTDGTTNVWSVERNSGLATAGTGDVLTGIVGGLLAQGLSPLRATAVAAFLHARAGKVAARRTSERYMTASDVIVALADVIP
jgi:ADP-dependent NAD(P)H-hydrate dehydratase / NAD(P)H-hydrate epimerase